MSSLIVLLPPLDVFEAESWTTMPMPYARFDGRARLTHAGDALPRAWPQAAATVLVTAARDTLLVDVALPPVTGTKLRRILPHAVEAFLIDDAQRCHVAIGPADKGASPRRVAVVEHERFRAMLDAFAAAGHRRVRVVPLIHCLPARAPMATDNDATVSALPDEPASDDTAGTLTAAQTDAATETANIDAPAADEADVLIVPRATSHADADRDTPERKWVELAVRQRMSGYGFTAPAAALDGVIAELARSHPVRVHALVVTPFDHTPHGGHARAPQADTDTDTDTGRPAVARPSASARAASFIARAFPHAARTLAWETLARGALDCPFDLCQFEFASGARAAGAAPGWRPWRFALGLAAASLVVAIAVVNIDGYRLRTRENALNAWMIDAVKTAFPGTTAVLDPHAQMRAGLERLRGAAGELRASDYPVLAAALSRALAPIPFEAVATLDYRDGTLELTFRPGMTLDAGALRRRLQAQGLSVQEDDAKWTLGSARPAPR